MKFSKMHGIGNDYVYVNCFEEYVEDPAALAVEISRQHYGVGSDGLIMICPSEVADFEMKMYNADGSESEMCGNGTRCVGKYVYDNGIAKKEELTIETGRGVKSVQLYTMGGKVTSASVDMGYATVDTSALNLSIPKKEVVNYPVRIGTDQYRITCVDVGNPHCVVFCEHVDGVDTEAIGPLFEHTPMFPERINTEFVRVVNKNMLKMRVWERGNGETLACGTGACAAVAAAVENGLCAMGPQSGQAVAHLCIPPGLRHG